MRLSARAVAALSAVPLLIAGLAGCGGAGTSAESASASATTAAPAPASPTAATSTPTPPVRRTHRPKPARTSAAPAPRPTTAAATTPPTTPPATARPTPPLTTTHAPRPAPTSVSPFPTSSSSGTSRYDYAFPIQGCRADPSSGHHDYPASDIFADRWCRFVAVVAGTVDEVSSSDPYTEVHNGATRGGRFVSIVGVDGVRYYGSHLQKVADGIAPGVRVRAGQLLGYVGNSGDAAGIATHVHFGVSWPTRSGVWWVRRGMVWPQRYLSSWAAGGNLSPRAAVRQMHAQDGDVPPCRVDC